MSQFVDLHMHTNCSDGLFSPADILDKVRSANLAAFAITDHDTLDGYKTVEELLTETDPKLISGVELSSTYRESELHILAYGIEANYIHLQNALQKFQDSRERRGRKMVEKLNQLGVKISYEDVQHKAGVGVIGRPHVAEAIFDSGAVNRYNEAFEKYIGLGRPAYVAKTTFAPDEALKLIHDAGGAAVLAHPGVGGAHQHIEMLVGMGLD
ncbi:MAG: PHP domain-containing protein, partial [Candidatus Zixiibacteriota bacterium]